MNELETRTDRDLAVVIVTALELEDAVIKTLKSIAEMLGDTNPTVAIKLMKMAFEKERVREEFVTEFEKLPTATLMVTADYYESGHWERVRHQTEVACDSIVKKLFKEAGLE